MYETQPLAPIRFTSDKRPKPIAHYESIKVFKSHVPKSIDLASANRSGASDFTTSWQDPDVEMEDAATQGLEDYGIPGAQLDDCRLLS
jgi:hypothetical protein